MNLLNFRNRTCSCETYSYIVKNLVSSRKYIKLYNGCFFRSYSTSSKRRINIDGILYSYCDEISPEKQSAFRIGLYFFQISWRVARYVHLLVFPRTFNQYVANIVLVCAFSPTCPPSPNVLNFLHVHVTVCCRHAYLDIDIYLLTTLNDIVT